MLVRLPLSLLDLIACRYVSLVGDTKNKQQETSVHVHSTWIRSGLAAALCSGLLSATSSFAASISWADWTDATAGLPGSASATITLPDSSTLGVSYTGEVRDG